MAERLLKWSQSTVSAITVNETERMVNPIQCVDVNGTKCRNVSKNTARISSQYMAAECGKIQYKNSAVEAVKKKVVSLCFSTRSSPLSCRRDRH